MPCLTKRTKPSRHQRRSASDHLREQVQQGSEIIGSDSKARKEEAPIRSKKSAAPEHLQGDSPDYVRPKGQVKSKQRVADHGEVFTPTWMVEAMLDLVKDETERIDSRFLKPASGSGNFLVQVLQRKLAAVEVKYGKSDFERRHYALLGLMCIYGIELLADNIAECRAKSGGSSTRCFLTQTPSRALLVQGLQPLTMAPTAKLFD